MKRLVPLAIVLLALALIFSLGVVFAQEGTVTVKNEQADHQKLMEYWTPERMANSKPMEIQESAAETVDFSLEAEGAGGGVPSYTLPWKPGSGPQPDPSQIFEIVPDETEAEAVPMESAPFNPPSSPSDYNNYPPFQRWTWFGRYLTYPTSTVGKLFFTLPGGGDSWCTASVIGVRTIATAASCILNPVSGAYTNFLFCPSYNRNGVNPATGCWGWESAALPTAWGDTGSLDINYGCIITSPTNPTTGKPVGDVTGWTGLRFNSHYRDPDKDLLFAHGYAGFSGFRGYHIYTCASPAWYRYSHYPYDAAYSYYIGCDQTAGATGGPWWNTIRHPNASFEVPPVDPSNLTDPLRGTSGPYLHGMTSSRRVGFDSEMGSPQFRNNPDVGGDTWDVFRACLYNE